MASVDNHYVRLGLSYGRLVTENARSRTSLGMVPLGEPHHGRMFDSLMRSCCGDWVWLAAISSGRTADEALACERRYLATLNL